MTWFDNFTALRSLELVEDVVVDICPKIKFKGLGSELLLGRRS